MNSSYPFDKRCVDCGHQWAMLGRIYIDSGLILEAMAAHDCDGIGVLAITRYKDDHYETSFIDTESAPHTKWES